MDTPAGVTTLFASPRDFATGAAPTADVVDGAYGEQVSTGQRLHTQLSDGVALGDFNRDGALDVVQTNVFAGSLSFFAGKGNGEFAKAVVSSVGVTPTFVTARDLDGDQRLDLVTADPGAGGVFVLRGDGNGGFAQAQFVAVPAARDVAIGDVDADGVVDLAVSSTAGAAVLVGAKADGAVTFSLVQFITPPSDPPNPGPPPSGGAPPVANSVILADFDDHAGDDLALGVGNSPNAGDRKAGSEELTGNDVLVYLNRDDTTGDPFPDAPSQRVRVGAEPSGFAAADLDGDARTDLVVLDNGNGDIATLLGDGNGHFTLRDRNTTVGCLPRSLKLADVNGDRIPDVVTAQFCAATVAVLLGRGDGTFTPALDYWVGRSPTAVDVGRVDGDGRPDVVVARLHHSKLSLLLNRPRAGDGVTVTRDVAYVPDDPELFAAHRTLDVYRPPPGTPSFAGPGTRYPVLLFAHGGAGVAGDKTMVSNVMRSFARDGIVAVSANYRLGAPSGAYTDAPKDVIAAFRWVRAHIADANFGGDPDNIVLFGHSAGAAAIQSAVYASSDFTDDVTHMRGLVIATCTVPVTHAAPPVLFFSGVQENAVAAASVACAQQATAVGADADWFLAKGQDHLSSIAFLARPDNDGRAAIMKFLLKVLNH